MDLEALCDEMGDELRDAQDACIKAKALLERLCIALEDDPRPTPYATAALRDARAFLAEEASGEA